MQKLRASSEAPVERVAPTHGRSGVVVSFVLATVAGVLAAVALGGGTAGVVLLSLIWLVPFSALVERALVDSRQPVARVEVRKPHAALPVVTPPPALEQWKRPLSSPPQRMPSSP